MLNRRNENLAVNKPKHIPAIVAAGIIGLALSALWFNQSGRVQAQSSDTPLMFSTIIERNLDSDQPHRYTVNLSAGQALSIATTQKRKANLILSALDSSGKTLTEVNCLDGSDETETMTFVAESTGQYFITIRLTKNSTQSGGYGLLAQPPHFASQTDHDRVAAQNDYQSGRELRNLRTGDARRKAVPLAENALRVWQAQGDRQWESVTLHLLGMLNYELGQTDLAMEYFNRALPIKQQLGIRNSEFSTLTFICTAFGDLGRNREALACRKQALPISRELGDEESALLLQSDIGLAHMLLGEKEPAQQNFNQALADSRATGNALSESLALQNLGTLFMDFGEYQQSPYQTHIEILMRLHQRQPAAGYATQALTFSERARARNLLDTLTEASTDLRAGLSPELLTQEKNLRFQINKREQARLAALPGNVAASQSELSDKEMTQLLSDFESLRAKIRQASPR